MDFLTLFAIYVVVVLTCIVLVCRYSGQQQNNPFNILLNTISTVVAPITPKWLQRLFQGTLHRLFHQRSNMFIYLHILLEGIVYAEFSYEVFGYCREMGISLTSLSVPYVLLAINTLFYYLCIKRDPGIFLAVNEKPYRVCLVCFTLNLFFFWYHLTGTVTKKKLSGLLHMYPYDRRLFHPGISCPTCHLIKPARSKHCRVCDRCIQRFDHHCVWVNNCIGALNTRYFLLYLFSLCAMAGNIAILTGDMLLEAVLLSGLLRAVYIDEYGQQQPTDPLFVTQHLFLTFPRIVLMLGFVVFVFCLLASYALFLFFLVLINQTSNEWYKSRGYVCQHCHPTSTADHFCSTAPHNSKRNYYSRGFLRNLGEIFFPREPVGKKDT